MSFLLVVVLGLAAQNEADRATRELIERFRSEKPEDRDAARRRLKEKGRAVVPLLEKAAKDTDPELAGRARELVRVIELASKLSPRVLTTFPGIEEQLAISEDALWTEYFLKIRWLRPPGTAKELAPLVDRAIRGARTKFDKIESCAGARYGNLKSAVPEIRKLLLDDEDDVKGYAATSLVELDAREAIPQIMQLIEQQGERAHHEFFDALEGFEAKNELLGLLKHRSHSVRGRAVWRLRRPEWKDAIPEVLKVLEDPYPANRGYAAKTLATLGARDVTPRILDVLQVENGDARYYAMEALAELGAKDAVPQILKLLKLDNGDFFSGQIRRAAANALGRIGAREAIPALIEALKDKDLSGFLATTGALADLKATEAIPALAALANHPENNIREDAIKTLGEIGSRDAIPHLRALLKSDDIGILGRAMDALVILDAREDLDDLVKLVEDKERNGRGNAAYSVGIIGGASEMPRLLKWLDSDDAGVRTAVVRVVGRFGDETHGRMLLKRLKDSDWVVLMFAVQELGSLGIKEAVPGIEPLLSHERWEVRRKAAEALCVLGSPKGIDVLLGDPLQVLPLPLNALRQPEEWKRLKTLRAPAFESASEKGILETLARRAGLGLEISSELSERNRRYLERIHADKVRHMNDSSNLLEVITHSIPQRSHILIEKDRIRIVTQDEAMTFWEAWSKAERDKPR